MSGLIIAEYQFRERTKCGLMPKDPAMVKTIVTTNMADPLAADYNVNLIEVLTGFKFIGEQIKFFEQNNSYNFVMGMEESYGCLVGTYARDKDAPVAVMCLCEAAAYCKSQGITLWDHMLDLYEKYGYYKEGLYTITLKGVTEQRRSARSCPHSELSHLLRSIHSRFSRFVITRRTRSQILPPERSQSQDFHSPTFSTTTLRMAHGHVYVHQEQSQRSSCTTESREQALMMQMQSLKLSRQHLLRSSTSWQSSISIIYSKYKKAPSGLVTGRRFAVIIR